MSDTLGDQIAELPKVSRKVASGRVDLFFCDSLDKGGICDIKAKCGDLVLI